MTQVVIFFGWLILCVAATLVVFGHLSIAFVYDLDTLLQGMFPDEGVSSLVYSTLAFIPGSVLLGIGKLMKHFDERAAKHEEIERKRHEDVV